MANVLIFRNGQEPEYKISVDEGAYLFHVPANNKDAQSFAKSGVLINPDLSGVVNVPRKFWKQVGTTVAEMTTAEKQAILDQETVTRAQSEDRFETIDVRTLARALVRLGLVTKAQLKQALQEVVANG